MEITEADSIREALKHLYTLLKKGKALAPTSHGLMALAIDGHESHATYHRCCSGCLERRVKTLEGWRTQYYHRNVTAMLLSRPFPFLIDAEPLQPGDDELAAARRLLRRVLQDYPRAFDIVLGDALYTDAKIYSLLWCHGKDVLTVLKANQPGLLTESQTLLETVEGQVSEQNGKWREIRQVGGFKPWADLDCEVRVVRSRESRHVRRQLDGQSEELLSEWLWATTCTPQRAHAEAIVALGHARWEIENQGFNEAVNHWHADHVYKHSANALLNFWLMTMFASNLFRAFYYRHLKPEVRRRASGQHIARCLAAELYFDPPLPEAQPPPGALCRAA